MRIKPIENEHPKALTLSLLIYAQSMQPGQLKFPPHRVLEQYMEDWPNDRRDKLYALLAQLLRPDTLLSDARVICSRCLHQAEKEHP